MSRRDRQDAEANEFAMHLLMPEELIIKECKNIGGVDLTNDRKIKKLANLFKVPIYAMSARLSQIKMNGMN